MLKTSSGRTQSEESIEIQDETFMAGDCILVKGESAKAPFVGRIRGFRNRNKGVKHTKVSVFWFYRPEECKTGRRQFHGEKELFKSNHGDIIDAETISTKCKVHSLARFRELEAPTESDFYCRFTYDPALDKFGPELVPVYCVCELPYNPDTYMIMCGRCEDWYHPRCLKLTTAEVKKYTCKSVEFYCPKCSPKVKSKGPSKDEKARKRSKT